MQRVVLYVYTKLNTDGTAQAEGIDTMLSLSSKRPLILALFMIAITPLLSAAISNEGPEIFARSSALIFAPANIKCPVTHVNAAVKGVGPNYFFGDTDSHVLFRSGLVGPTADPLFALMSVQGQTLAEMVGKASNKGIPSASNAATVGILNSSDRGFISGAIGGGLISVQPKTSVDFSKDFDFPTQSVTMQASSSRSSVDKSTSRNANFYRKARNAIDHETLLATSYPTMAMHSAGGRFQVQALGGPMAPIEGENSGDRLQAQFPILSMAW